MALTNEKTQTSHGETVNEESRKEDDDDDYSKWMFWKKRRYLVAILAFFGFFNLYSLRVNLSIAIVAMNEKKSITLGNGSEVYRSEFEYDSKIQGYLLSSFFYGYITTQLLGGWLSSKIGGKLVFGGGIAITAALTLITPWLANTNVYLFLTVRILEGIFEGFTYPCIFTIWARWAPPLERSRLATLAFSGSYVGTAVSMPTCAYLAKALGWQSIFYFTGGFGLIWFCLWYLIVAETPADDPKISKAELVYIQESLGDGGGGGGVDATRIISHPWKKILTSPPVWSIVLANACENWGFYTLLTQLPKFMQDVLNFELARTGFMGALPYLAMAIMLQVAGHLADQLQAKTNLTTTQVRKFFTCGAFLGQNVFMLGAAFWLTPLGCVICLTFAVGLGGFAWSGFSVNYLDVAPQHASVLMGLGNTIATLPGILSPIITGYVVTTPTVEEWQLVFYMACGVYVFGFIFYAIFASGDVQPWANDQQTTNEIPMQTKSEYDNRSFDTQ